MPIRALPLRPAQRACANPQSVRLLFVVGASWTLLETAASTE